MLSSQTEAFISKNGAWTAMSIKLSDGTYTREPLVDRRLKRLVQSAADVLRKPISSCRVLDLACLEGHYAIEFALHGAEAVGTEVRQTNLDKCNYAKEQLGLDRLNFVKDDVRNLSAAKYGKFDIVICSGILYHLPSADAAEFIMRIAEVCTGIALIDTFVSVSGRHVVQVNGQAARGHHYFEHHAEDDQRSREERLWASIDNADSFWFTEPTLVNLLIDAGFTSVMDILSPAMPGNLADRKTYLAVRGTMAAVLSSDPTHNEAFQHVPEGPNTLMDFSQTERGWLFRTMKDALPSGIKDRIKPALRAMRILPPDRTPEFMKNRSNED